MLVLAADSLGREKLGHHDVRAESAADAPEWRLGHPGHRGQVQRHSGLNGEGERHHVHNLVRAVNVSNVDV